MQVKYSSYLVLLFFFLVPFITYGQQDQQKEIKSEAVSSEIIIYKKPNCNCCTKWAAYLKKSGFSVTETSSDTLDAVKEHYLVPEDLKSCHIALIDGYVVEGHVPAESINKMLESQPNAQGIAVPGMPTGTPGMGNDGSSYEVILFDDKGNQSVYTRY